MPPVYFFSMKVLTARRISLSAGLWSLELEADCWLLMVFKSLPASRCGLGRANEPELELAEEFELSSKDSSLEALENTLEFNDNADLFVAKSSAVAFSLRPFFRCLLCRFSIFLSFYSQMLLRPPLASPSLNPGLSGLF